MVRWVGEVPVVQCLLMLLSETCRCRAADAPVAAASELLKNCSCCPLVASKRGVGGGGGGGSLVAVVSGSSRP